jgi:hypothetical protein
MGINAHIGLDLGIAAATVSQGQDLNKLRADFDKINTILSDLVDTVQEELAQMWPILKIIDWIAGKNDEAIARFSMNIAREGAWKEATQYQALTDYESRDAFVRERDQKVAAFGNRLAKPGFLVSMMLAPLRIFERGSVERKIRILMN